MRILIYSYNYHPEPIGIAPLMTELAEGLVHRGHRVRVITAMPNYPEREVYSPYRGKLYTTEQHNGVTVQRSFVFVRPRADLACRLLLELSFISLSLFQAFRGWQPDIILNTSPSLPAVLPVALLKRVYRCPTVLNLQDILPEAAIKTGIMGNPLGIRLAEMLEPFAYRQATAISVIDGGFESVLAQKGVPDRKIVTIPNWVNVDLITPKPKETSQFRKRHGLDQKFVVLYAGNIAETQGITNALHAAKALVAYGDIQLVVVGENRRLAALDQTRRALGITNVSLLPFVPRQDLSDMLAAADVGLILQKQTMVGFNMPSKTQLLLASGRPVLAAVPAAGAVAQTVRKSGSGLVVEPDNPLALAEGVLELYHHPDQSTQLGRQGRRYALDHYDVQTALDRYEALFEGLVPTAARLKTDTKFCLQNRHRLSPQHGYSPPRQK